MTTIELYHGIINDNLKDDSKDVLFHKIDAKERENWFKDSYRFISDLNLQREKHYETLLELAGNPLSEDKLLRAEALKIRNINDIVQILMKGLK